MQNKQNCISLFTYEKNQYFHHFIHTHLFNIR